MTPFLLKGAKVIPSKALTTEGCNYDSQQQLWTDPNTGYPLVLSNIANTPTPVGETIFTRTPESVDQPESSLFPASIIGETHFTETPESADQSEITTLVPNLRSNSSSIEHEGSANNLDFDFVLQFLIDAPYTHF